MTPEALTQLLHDAGVLQAGSIASIATTANPAFNSTVTHLRVTYSPDASPALPEALIVKRNLSAAWSVEAGRYEAQYYQLVAQQRERFPKIVPCYVATYDPATGDSLLIMQDVSATHHEPVTRAQLIAGEGVPDARTLERVARCLGELHAAWWESPHLGAEPLEIHPNYRDEAHFAQYWREREEEWQAFLAAEGAWFPTDMRDFLSEINQRFSVLWPRYLAERMTTRRNLTVTHGDAYLSNFLTPRQDQDLPVYLIDWQSPRGNIGAFDLAIMCATFWTPEQRHEDDREQQVLRWYLDALHTHGVTSYAWDDLWQDYRLMILFFMHVAIWDQTNGSSRDYWWPKLQRLVGAVRDLGCVDLLQ